MSENVLASEKVSGWANSVEPGQRFGMLVAVVEFHRERVPWWKCLCDCGREWEVRKGGLVTGRSTSCGCRRRRDPAYPAGPMVRLWRIWQGMLHRRRDGEDWKQRSYARRGIAVCDAWQAYGAFYAWSMANGYADGLTIDRRDNDGNYEPSICRWTTSKVQARNTRRTVWVEHGGSRVSLAEAVEELGLDYHAVYNRHVRAGRAFADVVEEMLGCLTAACCKRDALLAQSSKTPSTHANPVAKG